MRHTVSFLIATIVALLICTIVALISILQKFGQSLARERRRRYNYWDVLRVGILGQVTCKSIIHEVR